MPDRIEFDRPLPRFVPLRRSENPRVVSGLWFSRTHNPGDSLSVHIGRSRIACSCRLLERNPEGVSVLRFNVTIRTRAGFKWLRFCRQFESQPHRVIVRHLIYMPSRAAALPPLSILDYTKKQAELLAAIPTPRHGPCISVLMPVFDPPPDLLSKAIASVRAQTYSNWELCIADDASTDNRVHDLIRHEVARDPRIKVILRSANGHISAASNSALSLATGDWCALLDQDDELAPQAFAVFVHALHGNPDAELAYSDEDKISPDERRFGPYHKPDWMPELLLGQNYVSHLGLYRTDRLRAIGGFREGYEGCQDWDLVLRYTRELPATRIIHLPYVLYHWRVLPGSTAHSVSEKPYVIAAAERTIRDALSARSLNARITSLCPGQFRIGLIPTGIPVVTVLGLNDPADRTRLTMHTDGVTLRFDNTPLFDFANLAHLHEVVRSTATEFIVLMEPTFLPRHTDWLSRLAAAASMPGVAAVGGCLIDTAGHIISGSLGLDPAKNVTPVFRGNSESDPGYFGRAHLLHNPEAVDLRGMLLRRDTLLELRSLSCSSPADPLSAGWSLCAALRAAGARIVHDPGVIIDLVQSSASDAHLLPNPTTFRTTRLEPVMIP